MIRVVSSSAGVSTNVETLALVGDRSNYVTLRPDGLVYNPDTDNCMADDAGSYTYDDTGTTCTQSG